jgi:hypothetical protein
MLPSREAIMVDIAFLLLGAAIATAAGMTVIILGFQWLTGFPFRWGWRRHAAPVGKLLPQPDPPPPRRAPHLRLVKGGRLGHPSGRRAARGSFG